MSYGDFFGGHGRLRRQSFWSNKVSYSEFIGGHVGNDGSLIEAMSNSEFLGGSHGGYGGSVWSNEMVAASKWAIVNSRWSWRQFFWSNKKSKGNFQHHGNNILNQWNELQWISRQSWRLWRQAFWNYGMSYSAFWGSHGGYGVRLFETMKWATVNF